MASRITPPRFLHDSLVTAEEACLSGLQPHAVRLDTTECFDSRGFLCNSCTPHLESLRMELQFLKRENCRLLSRVLLCKEFADSAGLSPDEAISLSACLSLSLSTEKDQMIPAAVMHSLPPEAWHSRKDFYFAIVSSTVKEQIKCKEKEWKILAGGYNDVVDNIQQSERMLADVRNRNFLLESMNAKLLRMMSYKQRSLQMLHDFPSFMEQASSAKYLVEEPSDSSHVKSPNIGKHAVSASPACSTELKMGITCRVNNPVLYSSPVSVLGESFDNQSPEDNIGPAYNSPAYSFRGRTSSIESVEGMARKVGDDDCLGLDLYHALMSSQLEQEIHPHIKCSLDLLSTNNEFPVGTLANESHSRIPFGNLQCFNSVNNPLKRQLTSMFDTSLHLSAMKGCNRWSPSSASPPNASFNS